MNYPQSHQPPWQPQEKLDLLTEVIRQSRIPHEALVQFIHNNAIQPNWGDMLLPRNRTMNQCRAAYDEIVIHPRGTNLMRSTSVREFGPQPTAMKRPFIPEAANYGGRMIQPRPEGAPHSSANEPNEPPKKKRGRPTKAEAEERRQQAVARGEAYPVPRRSSTMATIAGPSSATGGTSAGGTSAAAAAAAAAATTAAALARPPSVAAAQAALGVAPRIMRTPPPQPDPPSSGSSSGKRRRGKPTRPEEDSRRAQETFRTAGGPGPSRYPDILSRDDPPEQRSRTAPSHSAGPEPPGPR